MELGRIMRVLGPHKGVAPDNLVIPFLFKRGECEGFAYCPSPDVEQQRAEHKPLPIYVDAPGAASGFGKIRRAKKTNKTIH